MRLDPAHTVFVDVDTQVDFMEPSGTLYVPGAEKLKPRLRALLSAARERAIPVVASADAHAADDPEFTVFPPHCVAGTAGARRVAETEPAHAVVADVAGNMPQDAPRGATVVLEKVVFDLFANPAADRVLRSTGADTAVVFGVALDYCVRAAALGLKARGYDTVVVRDATEAVTSETGAKAEAELRDAGVRFASTEEILSSIS
jgi:nicotinamidase/pyrazinamidase